MGEVEGGKERGGDGRGGEGRGRSSIFLRQFSVEPVSYYSQGRVATISMKAQARHTSHALQVERGREC